MKRKLGVSGEPVFLEGAGKPTEERQSFLILSLIKVAISLNILLRFEIKGLHSTRTLAQNVIYSGLCHRFPTCIPKRGDLIFGTGNCQLVSGSMVRSYLNSGFLLIGLGPTGMIFSAFADSIGLGRPGIGLTQLSGFVIGGLVSAGGLLKAYPKSTKTLAFFLTMICMSGILYMGLRPDAPKYRKVFLNFEHFGWRDFAINTVGFLPLGYLLMLTFESGQKERPKASLFKRAIIVAGAGVSISLFLEVMQYHITPGRVSSLFDWVANTLGTLVGIVLYSVMSITRRNVKEH